MAAKIRKLKPGASCVWAVRLLPIDVGYDLRSKNILVTIPDRPDLATDGVGYIGTDGAPCCVTGTQAEVMEVLAAAGYRVRPEWRKSPRKPAAGKRTEKITLRLTAGEAGRLRSHAEDAGLTITDWVARRCC